MRAVLWTGPDRLEFRRIARPDVPPGWALVQVEYTGLCGTDFAILHGSHPRAVAPLVMGHEITGVVAVSAGGGPAEGTRVTVEPLMHCGVCHPCSHANPHVCQNLKLYGIDAPGSLAEYVALPPETLVPVSAGAPVLEVALAEPLAVAIHAVHRAGLVGGEHVAVFGAGPIGLLTALVARHAGAEQVLVIETSPQRRPVAAALGFATTDSATAPDAVAEGTGGVGADVVFDCAGHPAVAAELAGVARVHGTVVIVGVYKHPSAVQLRELAFKELCVVGARVYRRADVERAVALVEQDALGLGRLPIRVFPLEEAARAFDVATAAGDVVKVLVSPQPLDG